MRAFLFFIPYFVSLFYSDSSPELQYWICWTGSIWILLATFAGWVNPLPKDRTFTQQFMRPFIFAHLLLSGYMAFSSIFFFFNAKGYFFFDIAGYANPQLLAKTAKCQQYYVLAHAAFATGLTFWMNGFGNSNYYATPRLLNAQSFLKLTIITFLLSELLGFLPIGSGIRNNIGILSLLSSILFLIYAFSDKKMVVLAIALLILNFWQGILTGMKEASLIIVLFLGAYYFSKYRLRTIVIGSLALWLWFSIVPTISIFIRTQSWDGGQSATSAVQNALASIRENSTDTKRLNWELLVNRSSEIGMFIRYVEHVPSVKAFYGLEIVENAFMGLLPRFIRPDGRSIDETAMERVYGAGIIDKQKNKTTSAKPALVADAYMSGAEIGILITFFLFGAAATQLAKNCERYFGGYTLGSGLIFNGCFSIFQKGNCFENIPVSLFYGLITMYIMYYILLETSILVRTNGVTNQQSIT